MKQEIKLGLFGIGIIFLLTIYYSFQYQQITLKLKAPGTPITLEEVAKHNLTNDCWIVFEGKVYNLLPSHLQNHPGGGGLITPFCGQDATQAFLAKNGQGSHSHSSAALQQLGLFYIGDLNSKR